MAEIKGKAVGVALMSSLSYSFCSVSMVMSNKASLCALCLARVLVAPAASVGCEVRFDRVIFFVRLVVFGSYKKYLTVDCWWCHHGRPLLDLLIDGMRY